MSFATSLKLSGGEEVVKIYGSTGSLAKGLLRLYETGQLYDCSFKVCSKEADFEKVTVQRTGVTAIFFNKIYSRFSSATKQFSPVPATCFLEHSRGISKRPAWGLMSQFFWTKFTQTCLTAS